MDESSLGILLPEEMNLDGLSVSSNDDEVFSYRRSLSKHSSNDQENDNLPIAPRLNNEDQTLGENMLNYHFGSDDDDENIDFKELGFDEEDLAILTGNISDMDTDDDANEMEDLGEEEWLKEHMLAMKKEASTERNFSPAELATAKEIDIGPRAGRGVGCAGDSPLTSDIDTYAEIQAAREANYQNHWHETLARLDARESAEGSVVTSPLPGGGGGDGSSQHSDDSAPPSVRQNETTGNVGNDGERICPQGVEDGGVLPQIFFQPTRNQSGDSYCIKPWADESSLLLENLQARSSNCPADGSERAIYLPTSSRNDPVFREDQISARSSSLPFARSDTFQTVNTSESTKPSTSTLSTIKDSGVELQKTTEDIGNNLPLTDLAFYTDLRNKYGSETFTQYADTANILNEEFMNATDALQVLDLDEKNFEQFSLRQENAQSTSFGHSWTYQEGLDVSRPSWISDDSRDRISIGKFLRSKTNPLGTLDGNKDEVERPTFGNAKIVSPRCSMIVEQDSILSRKENPDQVAEKFTADASSMLSISTINKFIRDASISTDSNALADQILKLAKQMKKQKKQTLKELQSFSVSSTSSNRKKHSKSQTTEIRNSEQLPEFDDMIQNWEPVRPSSIYFPRPSENKSTLVRNDNQPNPAFENTFKKPFDINTPNALIPQNKNSYPTSTPFCGDVTFPVNFNDSGWPSRISSGPTPKPRTRMEPRTIIEADETLMNKENEENLEERNKSYDADRTLTDINTSFEIKRRLSGGQDTRLKSSDKLTVQLPSEQKPVSQSESVLQQVNLLNYNLGNVFGSESSGNDHKLGAFLPLTHNTLTDSELSDTARTINETQLKHSFVQLPALKKNMDISDYRPSISVQMRDCDTVSLQRTSSIRVQSELKFSEVACVGIRCEATLPIQNLTSRWLKCNFHLISLTVDSQSLPTEISPFIFKHETIIEPNSIDKFQLIYASRVPGAVVAQLQVTAQPIVPTKPGTPELSTSCVTLTAEAEHPKIDILLDGKRMIDFGTLAEDSCREIDFGLVNIGPATVPIRLVIQGTGKPWQGYYFSKKNLTSGSPTAKSLVSSNIISFSMPGQSDGSNTPKVFNTKVAFRAPSLEVGAQESVLSVSATLNVEVDVSGNPATVLHSIPLAARVGTVRLETVKDLEPVNLQSIGGKPASCKIPLRNSGSIPLILEATISHSPQLFVITPHSLQVPPGQESEISITFVPQGDVNRIVGGLLLTLYPGGPSYEIQLIAEVMTAAPVINVESNKHFLIWGGVELGGSQDQNLALRSSGPLQEIDVSIKGDSETYWLSTRNGNVQNYKYSVQSGKEIPICVKFAPKSAKLSAAKVVIKPLPLPTNTKPIRYVIPLVGYGGRSKLQFIGLQKDERGIYTAQIEQTATNVVYSLNVKNVGDWAAFVKVIPFTDDNTDQMHNLQATRKSSDFVVTPNEFVVGSQKVVKVTVVVRSGPIYNTVTGHNSLGLMTILYGDELSRKRFRRALQNLPQGGHNNPMQSTANFDVTYLGELVAKDENMPSTPNDIQLFYNGINHCQVQLLATSSIKSQFKNYVRPETVSRDSDVRPIITASPPVRELHSRMRPHKSWDIVPKQLTLPCVNKTGVMPTATLVLRNLSTMAHKFYFVWPGHMFNIDPASGVLQPRDIINVNVSLTSPELSEWEGKIFAKCDNSEEEITVLVISKNDNRVKENAQSPVKIRIKEIAFSPTAVNCSSEFLMDMENTSASSQQWILSSVNPAVIKMRDGEIRKVSYSSFRFTKMSGFLKAGEIGKIPVTFLPLEEGEFMQKWEFVTKDSGKKSCRITLKLLGKGVHKFKQETAVHPQISVIKNQARSKSLSTNQNNKDIIQLATDVLVFPPTRTQTSDRQTIQINNISQEEHSCQIMPPKPPFFINHLRLNIKNRRFIKLPIYFKPTHVGTFSDTLKIDTDTNQTLDVRLSGTAIEFNRNADDGKN